MRALAERRRPGAALEVLLGRGRPSIWRNENGRLDCGPAVLHLVSANGKLAPVDYEPTSTRPRPVPREPFVASTYLPIRQTCPSSCRWKGNGCYASEGWTRFQVRRLEQTADDWSVDADEIIRCESDLLARAPWIAPGEVRGRDLRLHVAGDVSCSLHAELLDAGAARWKAGGGGSIWTYTHAWREIDRAAWGPDISVLASIERAEDAEPALRQGYAPAIVIDEFPSERAFRLPGSHLRWIPCPAETRSATCVECRLCIDRDLIELGAGIAFAMHGPGAERAVRRLPVVAGEEGAVAKKSMAELTHCPSCAQAVPKRNPHWLMPWEHRCPHGEPCAGTGSVGSLISTCMLCRKRAQAIASGKVSVLPAAPDPADAELLAETRELAEETAAAVADARAELDAGDDQVELDEEIARTAIGPKLAADPEAGAHAVGPAFVDWEGRARRRRVEEYQARREREARGIEELAAREDLQDLRDEARAERRRGRAAVDELGDEEDEEEDEMAKPAKQITHAGITDTVAGWAERAGINVTSMHGRLGRMPVAEALAPALAGGDRDSKPEKSTPARRGGVSPAKNGAKKKNGTAAAVRDALTEHGAAQLLARLGFTAENAGPPDELLRELGFEVELAGRTPRGELVLIVGGGGDHDD